MNPPADIVVIGAGPWGLATAWRAGRAGARVTLLDDGRTPAAHVAAGMLGALSEAVDDERDMFAPLRAAADMWPAFAADLATAAGRDAGLRPTGALGVAARPEQVPLLRRRRETLAAWGVACEWRTGSELRAVEPGLGPSAAGGLAFPDEHQVEPRAFMAALRAAVAALGIDIREAGADALLRSGAGAVCGVRDAHGHEHAAHRVVLAAGHSAGRLSRRVPVRPVKGQILRLREAHGAPVPIARTIRTPEVYLAPRDGEVVVGATTEERADRHATAVAVHELLDEALHTVPELAEMELAEIGTGLRPATADGRPAVGPDADGVIWAAGGHRNGLLLAPLASAAAAATALGEPMPEHMVPFSPGRFEEVTAR